MTVVVRLLQLRRAAEWCEAWDAQDAARLVREGWVLGPCSRSSLAAVQEAEAALKREETTT